MQFKQVVGNRRSIRYFEPDKPVEKEKVQVMLEAANRASRAGNIDFWKALVVYRDEFSPATIDLLRVPTTTADLDLAPVYIFFFADLSYADDPSTFQDNLKELISVGALNPSHGYSDAYVDDVVLGTVIKPLLSDTQTVIWMATLETGLAISQAMLAAVDEGLGVCLHAYNVDTARAAFGFPDHWVPCWVLLVGYPAEDPLTSGQRPRRPLSDFVYVNSLDNRWADDPATTARLKREGLIQAPVDVRARMAEVRELAEGFGLPQ